MAGGFTHLLKTGVSHKETEENRRTPLDLDAELFNFVLDVVIYFTLTIFAKF